MKVSIITLNYNNLSGLRRTLPSVLMQTYDEYELIVVDGGSTDGSKEYIESLNRIDRWVSEPDDGIYNAMNKAVGMANGEFCIFMNSGDMFFSPTSLEEAVPYLGDGDFYTGSAVFIDNSNAYPNIPPETMSVEFLMNDALNHQSTFNRTAVLKSHPFNEKLKIMSDWELFLEEWYFNKRTYCSIPVRVAVYFMDGVSAVNRFAALEERHNEAVRLLGEEVVGKYLNNRNRPCKKGKKHEIRRIRLQEKLNRAMAYSNPVTRDLKIIRNGFKFLFKDLFT